MLTACSTVCKKVLFTCLLFVTWMLQDDTYTESYISTIGVDFVSVHVVHVHTESLCSCVNFCVTLCSLLRPGLSNRLAVYIDRSA